MFTGFSDDTVRYFLDLRFNNNISFFHESHDRYLESVQKPFYDLISELSPLMLEIDPGMETRPNKCLSHIHRDTRFTKDKSPYRDHLWFLFRRAAEPRDKALNFYFEFGPGRLGWGMGFWGENREAMDRFRRLIISAPDKVRAALPSGRIASGRLSLGGSIHKRMSVPEEVPDDLKRWYLIKEMYISCSDIPYGSAFTSELTEYILEDFEALAPLYKLLRGMCDRNPDEP